MSAKQEPRVRLFKSWSQCVRSSVLHGISLAQYATDYTRSWAADSSNRRLRQKAELERFSAVISLLREEIRIKVARMERIPPHRRPRYRPTERMAILELRAAQGWNACQTARTFLVTVATIASWMKRVDEEGPDALLQLHEPVNRFPEFVRYVVRLLKVLCPSIPNKNGDCTCSTSRRKSLTPNADEFLVGTRMPSVRILRVFTTALGNLPTAIEGHSLLRFLKFSNLESYANHAGPTLGLVAAGRALL